METTAMRNGSECISGREPLKQVLTIELVLLPSGPLLFSHKEQNQFECLPEGEAEAEVVLLLGVVESGRGAAGTGQGGPPPTDPEVSQEMETSQGGDDTALRWGWPSYSGVGAYWAKLKMVPGRTTDKNNGSDNYSMVS